MDNIQPVARSLRPVPIIKPAASHTVFAPVQQAEYGPAQKHIEGRRPLPVDRCEFSAEALKKAREHYDASELAMCADCECVHRKGPCPLLCDEPLTDDIDAIEFRADWNPGLDPAYGGALWAAVGALVAIIALTWWLSH